MSEAEIREIWRRLDRLEAAEPNVVADRVRRMSDDVVEMEKKIDAMRRTLMGFLLTFAFTGITIVISTAALIGSG